MMIRPLNRLELPQFDATRAILLEPFVGDRGARDVAAQIRAGEKACARGSESRSGDNHRNQKSAYACGALRG